MTTGKTIALTWRSLVGKVMSLLLNILSRLVISFLLRSKRLLISWLQSPSAVILELKQSLTLFPLFPHLFPMKWWDQIPGGSAGKESACYVGDLGSIPGLGRSPGEGSGYPLLYSGLVISRAVWLYGPQNYHMIRPSHFGVFIQNNWCQNLEEYSH